MCAYPLTRDREIVSPGSLRPDIVEYISYDTTDFLQAEGHIALACPVDLETSSAALRYVLRECGREQAFSLRPRNGEILTLTLTITNKPAQTIHLLITRASQRAPLIADDLPAMLEKVGNMVGGQRSFPCPLLQTGPQKASILLS